MTENPPNLRFWNYFLTLERDFIATTSYCEPCRENFGTFSDRYAALLILIGSEVDVVCKAICLSQDHRSTACNMPGYHREIRKRYRRISKVEVSIKRFGIRLKPWRSWRGIDYKSTTWWKSYNNVKHNREIHRRHASQINVLEALAGLLVLEIILYQDTEIMYPFPEMMGEEWFPAYYISGSPKKLPGID